MKQLLSSCSLEICRDDNKFVTIFVKINNHCYQVGPVISMLIALATVAEILEFGKPKGLPHLAPSVTPPALYRVNLDKLPVGCIAMSIEGTGYRHTPENIVFIENVVSEVAQYDEIIFNESSPAP